MTWQLERGGVAWSDYVVSDKSGSEVTDTYQVVCSSSVVQEDVLQVLVCEVSSVLKAKLVNQAVFVVFCKVETKTLSLPRKREYQVSSMVYWCMQSVQ